MLTFWSCKSYPGSKNESKTRLYSRLWKRLCTLREKTALQPPLRTRPCQSQRQKETSWTPALAHLNMDKGATGWTCPSPHFGVPTQDYVLAPRGLVWGHYTVCHYAMSDPKSSFADPSHQ